MISASKLKKIAVGRRLLIDSNIIIYLTDAVEPYLQPARLLFEIVEAGQAKATISILSIGEVMQGPIRNNQPLTALEVKDYLLNFPNCQCQEITLDVIESMGNDKRIEWKGLRTIDSLIIASGLVAGVDLFVSNDRHFRQAISNPMILGFD